MVLMSDFSILLPLAQQGLLLLISLFIYLLKVPFLLVGLFEVLGLLGLDLFLKLVHVFQVILLFLVLIIANLLDLVAEESSQFGLVELFLLLCFVLL